MQATSIPPARGGNAGLPGSSSPAPARWRLRLLGGFELNDGAQRLERLPSRPMVSLLARLALAPQRNHPREELVELLWPGVDPQVSRNRLRQTLSILRALLEPPSAIPAPVLRADRFDVSLVPGAVDCDVVAFERHARLGHAAEALALYRGELLPGFYDEWLVEERQRLEAMSMQLALHLQSQPPAPSAATPAVPSPPAMAAEGLLAVADAAAAPAALLPTPTAPRAALPVYLTRHFMADSERASWLAMLAQHRVVTLLGPGGAGKTRLAVELARALPGVDRLAFVSLAACDGREQALDSIAQALGAALQRAPAGPAGVPEGTPDPSIEAIARALQGQALLLVLDNFEQLVDGAADIVTRLAEALPRLRLLITSRRALGIEGEHAVPLEALALPARGLSLAEALANPAVALFLDRTQQVRADAHLSEQNRASVIELMHALEGLPLAIELAASRSRSLSPARILELLAQDGAPRLALLSRGSPRASQAARHASMEHTIRWSWQQLSDEERSLLQVLACFSGGCTVAAAAMVRGIPEVDAALQLDALVACSMLRVAEAPDGELRFHMYEPIREFARVELRRAAAGGGEAALRAAHRAWMMAWAEGLPVTPSLSALRSESANLSLALRTAVADGDPAAALRTVLALGRAHDDLVLGAEPLASLEQALRGCEDVSLRSRGHTQLAQLLFAVARGDEARQHAQQGVVLAPDDAGLRANALHVKARLQWLLEGHAPWLDALVDEAEALAQQAQVLPVLARITVLRAAIAYAHRKDFARGEALYRQALAIWQRLGNRHAINAGRYYVALVVQAAGRHAEAIERIDEVIAQARQLDDLRRASQALQVRGKALAGLRRWPEAAASLHDAIRLAWEAMAMVELTRALRDLPRVLAHLRRAEAAVRLQAYAQQAAEAHIGRADRYDRYQQRRVRRLVQGRVSPARWDSLRREGAALDLSQALALALAESAGG